MADEVIVVSAQAASNTNGIASGAVGDIVTTQVLDIGTKSAAISGEVAVLISKGTGFWFKLGASDVSAAVDTDGNIWLPADSSFSFELSTTQNYVDTAADA
ncbi:MAG: hypothetical protein ACPGJI_08125 [Kangiellaceae bacterium]